VSPKTGLLVLRFLRTLGYRRLRHVMGLGFHHLDEWLVGFWEEWR